MPLHVPGMATGDGLLLAVMETESPAGPGQCAGYRGPPPHLGGGQRRALCTQVGSRCPHGNPSASAWASLPALARAGRRGTFSPPVPAEPAQPLKRCLIFLFCALWGGGRPTHPRPKVVWGGWIARCSVGRARLCSSTSQTQKPASPCSPQGVSLPGSHMHHLPSRHLDLVVHGGDAGLWEPPAAPQVAVALFCLN